MGDNKQAAEAKKALAVRDNYLDKNQIADFGAYKPYQKLAMLQTLDKKYFGSREIGGQSVSYLPHEVAEKALNLAFNFNVDVEIEKDGADTVKRGQKYYFEVTMQVKFTFTDNDGNKIVRTVYSGHKQYENPALSKADCYKAALSKAYTVVARTFGIGSVMADGKKEHNVAQQEDQAYEATVENPPKEEETKKSFGAPY
jgi:hypothetical protein